MEILYYKHFFYTIMFVFMYFSLGNKVNDEEFLNPFYADFFKLYMWKLSF